MYLRELCLACDVPVVPVEYLSKCEGIIYNRVPKCGSTTMSAALRRTSKANEYAYIWILNYQFTVTQNIVKAFVHNMTSHRRFVLINHHFLFNFNQYINKTLLYINIIREPVSWFISSYNYYHYQSPGYKNKWWNRAPMLTCINDSKCFNYIIQNFGAVRFLCGVQPICNQSQSGGALQLAKRNVDSAYLLVGVTEELETFTILLEHFLPHMFKNMSQMQLSKKRNVTKQKENVTTTTISTLANLLPYELDLYQFVKQRFHKIQKAALPTKVVV
jgi:hypothetical protein